MQIVDKNKTDNKTNDYDSSVYCSLVRGECAIMSWKVFHFYNIVKKPNYSCYLNAKRS